MTHGADTKKCTRCGEIKPRTEYTPRKDRPGQVQPHCKGCDKFKTFEWREKRRLALLTKYTRTGSIECELCKENDQVVLTIDHMNKDGNAERKPFGKATQAYYTKLLTEDRTDLRVLCQNCNWREHVRHIRRHLS